MNITIQTIPHDQQRYETCGDWWFDDKGNLEIRVSSMNNWRYESLVAFHELAEVLLCKHKGIATEDVDAFDIQFEKDRADGLHDEQAEPGNDPAAPYYRQHGVATALERLLATEMEVNWDEYDNAVVSL